MRKMKCIITVLFVLVIVISGITAAHADTMYTVDGYTYTLNSKGLAVLVGWDNSSDTLYVPYGIGNVLVAEIGNSAFQNDDFIKHLDLHDARRMYHIGEFAFAGSALEGELVITTQVTYVGTAAFEGCGSLTSVTYGSDGGTVSAQCFKDCSSLETVTLSSFVHTIKQYAFMNCPSLTQVVIPKSVTSIDKTAFQDSDNIVIYCYRNSCAHEFAEENGIDYVLYDPPQTVTYVVGDADGDGEVTILDSTKIQRVLAELDTDADGMITLRGHTYGDDPELNIMDATGIQRFLADFVVDIPFGEEVTVEI